MANPPTRPLPDPSCEMTPDGSFVFEIVLADGTRAVAAVLPEDVDEIAGPLQDDPPGPEERRRRQRVAWLLAEPELRVQLEHDH